MFSQWAASLRPADLCHEDLCHEDLCHATAQVTPASCSSIGSANHIWGKHQRAPELVRDEGGSCRTTAIYNQGLVELTT